MRSFAREVPEKDFTSMPRMVSKFIQGYKTAKGQVRYIVLVRGLYGGTFATFDEADKERRNILKFLEDAVG